MALNTTTNHHIVDSTPITLEVSEILAQARVNPGSKAQYQLERLIEAAQAIARPKALYKTAYIESRSDNTVTINHVTFKSRILRVNLDKVERVFVYLATCGKELDQWSAQFDDLLIKYWADLIKQAALHSIRQNLQTHIETSYRPGRISAMSPGSLEEWPLDQQKPLFHLLDGVNQSIDVQLTDTCLMIPTKSVSGVFFSTEESFESCQLCTRSKCPGRRSAYKPALWDKYE
jgi:hypothetical protein